MEGGGWPPRTSSSVPSSFSTSMPLVSTDSEHWVTEEGGVNLPGDWTSQSFPQDYGNSYPGNVLQNQGYPNNHYGHNDSSVVQAEPGGESGWVDFSGMNMSQMYSDQLLSDATNSYANVDYSTDYWSGNSHSATTTSMGYFSNASLGSSSYSNNFGSSPNSMMSDEPSWYYTNEFGVGSSADFGNIAGVLEEPLHASMQDSSTVGFGMNAPRVPHSSSELTSFIPNPTAPIPQEHPSLVGNVPDRRSQRQVDGLTYSWRQGLMFSPDFHRSKKGSLGPSEISWVKLPWSPPSGDVSIRKISIWRQLQHVANLENGLCESPDQYAAIFLRPGDQADFYHSIKKYKSVVKGWPSQLITEKVGVPPPEGYKIDSEGYVDQIPQRTRDPQSDYDCKREPLPKKFGFVDETPEDLKSKGLQPTGTQWSDVVWEN